MSSQPESRRPREHVVSPRATIWAVDDSPLEAEVIRRELASQFDVRVFTAGAAALEHLADCARPDVFVLDWYMPDVSGAEVCRFIRKRYNSAQLPIAILTAAGTTEALLEALDAGANDFVEKPVASLELNARVAGLVRLAKLHYQLSETDRKLRLEAVFRERFMGMLAHDLRQPLSTVLMGGQVLSQLDLPDKAAVIVQRQLRAVERMQRMVTDLLDSTRHSPASGMPIAKRWTDFAEVARTTLDETRAAHPDRELALTVEGWCEGYWDADRLAQILSNLVANALTHGEGGCRIDVQLSGGEQEVELRVSNRGAPIPEEILTTLDQPFRRSRSERRTHEGLGLGLHIVHHITQAHGGTLASESAGGMTHLIVRLPRDDRREADDAPPLSGWS